MTAARFEAGDRVLVLGSLLAGYRGTLVRRAWWFWQRAWLVDLDTRSRWIFKRTRIVEQKLVRLPVLE